MSAANVRKARNRIASEKMTPLMALIIFALVIYFVIIAYPLIWMLFNSLKTYKEIYKDIWALPSVPQWQNFTDAWEHGISNYFLNSLLVTGSTVIGAILFAALAAYALARFRFRGSQIIFAMIMGGMMLSPQVTLIPLYKIIQTLNIHNTFWALIIPYIAYRIPLIVMLVRSHFLTIPKEMEESAILDGCSSFGVFTRIFLPMSKPILLTATILVAYYAWNEFMYALIFIDSDKLRTIPVGLMNLRDALLTNWGVLLAGMTISALPLIILFLLMQKQFIRGMTAGAVKG
ncbi:MAG: carbohydrate ABC transporter permease [Clostridia bacterium]|nr:carbohydrate ABC transporter permease [Clostridia bacterium]